jgi:type IX secretion system PorP/SprF family membrane protein
MLNKGRFRSRERTGLGASIYHDQNGPIHTTGLRVAYAYHIPFRISSLSFGLALSFSDQRINYNLLNPTDPDDMLLLNQNDNIFMLNSDAGFYYYNERYFLGFSVTELVPAWNKQKDPGYEYNPNLFLQAGYRFSIIRNLLYEPSVRVRKTMSEKTVAEFNSKFYFANSHWAGINLRSDRTLCAYVGINLRRYIYLAYIYEYSFGAIGSHFNNTHSIMIGQNIGLRSISGLRKIISW